MNRVLHSGLVFLLLLFTSPGFAQDSPVATTIDRDISAFMSRWNLPAASLALVKNERLVYVQAYGQADQESAVTPQHLFRIASLSKPITALAIIKLKEQGKLKLTDRIFGPKGILPYASYPFFDRRILDITVRQLLQHTAGWDRHANIGGDPMFNQEAIAAALGVPAPVDAETTIRYVLKKPLDFAPGTRYAYANIGYTILGRVIEALSGSTYEAYVLANVLQPLGILDMRLARNFYGDKDPAEVRYYEKPEYPPAPGFTGNQQGVPGPYGSFNIEAMDANAGWLATATDLARVLAATDGLPHRRDILPAEELQQLWQTTTVSPDYGLGWMVNARGLAWHSGSLPGTAATMARLPDGTAWVLLFNGRHDSPAFFQDLDALMWRTLNRIKPLPDQDLFTDPVLAAEPVQK